MKTNRKPGTRPANPENPITLTLGFAASEADRELVERLAVATGARSISEAIREAIRNEFARVNSRQIRAGLDKMAPVEKKLFQDGFVDQYVKMVRESGDRRNILNSIASSPAARERIMMALGPSRAKELESFLRVEGIMDRARTSLGNSTTARQLAELGIAGGYNLYEGGGRGSKDPEVLMNTLAIYGALRGSRSLGSHIDERLVKHVAQLLTSNNVRDLDKRIKLISRNKTLFKAIQNADAAAGAVGTRGAVSGVTDSDVGSRESP